MELYAIVVRMLAALTWGLAWLLCICVWILQPITQPTRYAGLAAIGLAIWLQHRPKRT